MEVVDGVLVRWAVVDGVVSIFLLTIGRSSPLRHINVGRELSPMWENSPTTRISAS